MSKQVRQMKQQAEAPLSDNVIIEKILGGEKQLFGDLMRRYNRRVFRVCFSVMQDDLEAEEMMQVAYVRAYERLAQFRFESEFSTWLTRIALNECFARQKKRRRSVPDPHTGNNVSDTETPYKMLVANELRILLEEAVNRLPEKYRTVFVLREVEGLPVADTMTCLGLTETNVKVRLSRAKEMLRDNLSAYYRNHELFPFHLTRCDRVVERVLDAIGVSPAR